MTGGTLVRGSLADMTAVPAFLPSAEAGTLPKRWFWCLKTPRPMASPVYLPAQTANSTAADPAWPMERA